jgi:hypothetical protein
MVDIEPQLLTVEQTCQFLNISRALLYSRLSCECFLGRNYRLMLMQDVHQEPNGKQ